MGDDAIEKLRALQVPDGDIETQHQLADDVLCELLTALGYGDVVREWNAVPKWYA